MDGNGGVTVVRSAAWDAVLTRLRGLDCYTSAAYHEVSALLEPAGTVPALLHHAHEEGETALPVLLRPVPEEGWWDASSAYGYGGPVASTDSSAAVFGPALDAWARAHRVVATFLRLHPILGNTRWTPPGADLVALGGTVAWDVSDGRDLVGCMHAHHRRAVRRADRAGLEVTVTPQPPSLGRFRELYDETMCRRGAAPFYFFPPAYWEALTTRREPLGLVLVEGRLRGNVVAALLCLSDRSRLHYHLGASTDAGREIGASHRCFLAAAEWARGSGRISFHLGGGLGGDTASPLLVFKHRFDPASPLLPFHVAKMVHDPDRYVRLAGTGSTSGFFPPWRGARTP